MNMCVDLQINEPTQYFTRDLICEVKKNLEFDGYGADQGFCDLFEVSFLKLLHIHFPVYMLKLLLDLSRYCQKAHRI